MDDTLFDSQNAAYAQRYSSFVDEIAAAEREALNGSEAFSLAVANNLAKLMAYKDEYEVARLHSDPATMERIRGQFDGDVAYRGRMFVNGRFSARSLACLDRCAEQSVDHWAGSAVGQRQLVGLDDLPLDL